MVKNLLKNAILYTTNNHVSLLGEIKQDKFILTIRNKGFIDDVDLLSIFEPFYRVNKGIFMGASKGTGLGLSIVKQICELYGYPYKLFNDSGDVVAKIIIDIQT